MQLQSHFSFGPRSLAELMGAPASTAEVYDSEREMH